MMERQKLWRGFRLAEWLIRPEDGSLASPASSTRLEPLLMELLVFLCSRAGQVVPKQEVLAAVWGGRFVSDETVKGSFYQLRKALGDNPRAPRFIETLPKRGYRMLVEPELLSGPPAGEAQDLAKRGRAALSEQPTEASLRQARIYFERAVEAEPDDASALAGLARTYVLMVNLGLGSAAEFLARSRVAATRALELDPDLGEPHLALAVVRFFADHDAEAAERDFRIAVQRSPHDSLAHIWYARLLAFEARHDEAVAEARRALEADPLSIAGRRELLNVLFAARRYDETIAEAHRFLDLNPGSSDVHLGMVWIYLIQKKDQQAFESFLAGLKAMGVAGSILQHAQEVFTQGGMPAILRSWVEMLERNRTLGERNQVDLVILHCLLGDLDRCFELLDPAVREQYPYLFWLRVLPVFDNLRRDPRYERLLESLGYESKA